MAMSSRVRPNWARRVSTNTEGAFVVRRRGVMRHTRRGLPAARDEGLLVEKLGDETVIYDAESTEAHCLSATAAVVFAHCDGRTTVDELVARASERLDEPVDSRVVLDALAQLEERNLLVGPAGPGGLSRREVLGRGAKLSAAAAAVPLITSIAVPTAASAQTQIGCGGIAGQGGVACCPCNPGADVGQVCCEHATRANCTCTAAEAGVSCKQCKTGGSAANEEKCCAEFPGVGYPPNVDAVCPCSFAEAECPP